MLANKRAASQEVSRESNPYSRKLNNKDTPMRNRYYVPKVSDEDRRAWY